jgi:hypothetical protein
MRPPTLDPTAGRRARAIRSHPGAPQPITDPTHARYGLLDRGARTSDVRPIADPTDPRCGAREVRIVSS